MINIIAVAKNMATAIDDLALVFAMTATWVNHVTNVTLRILNSAVYATRSNYVRMIAQMLESVIFTQANVCAEIIEKEKTVRYRNARLIINFAPTAMMINAWSVSRVGV
jgi:hypothetical protein